MNRRNRLLLVLSLLAALLLGVFANPGSLANHALANPPDDLIVDAGAYCNNQGGVTVTAHLTYQQEWADGNRTLTALVNYADGSQITQDFLITEAADYAL